MTVETETIARLLARGFNEHIRLHGPDGDHAEAAEAGGGHSLVVTRDGAQYAVRVEPLQAPQAAPSLAERVIACLLSAGFRGDDDSNRSRFPAFEVGEGAGVTVEVRWVNAGDDWRARLLGKYAAALRADGFKVCEQDGHLYVPEPKRAEASCICPPGIRASGGFRTGCPADHPSTAAGTEAGS
jgi:hypothetical protein